METGKQSVPPKSGTARDERRTVPLDENTIAKAVVNAAYRVHTQLGPGLLESVYETIMAHELDAAGLRVVRQMPVPVP